MNKKTVVVGGLFLLALAAAAMPTDKELVEARGIVTELMSGPVADQKAGRMTHAQMAEKALELADAAETEAAKMLLVRGAVVAFARDGESARAASALSKLRAEVNDLSPDFEADALSRAVKALPSSSDKTLYEKLEDARRLVKCRKDIPILEKRLAKKEDPAMRGQLAESLAALGDWKRALEEFAKVGGEVARVAKFENGAGGKIPSAEVADFWWNYPGVKDSSGYSVFQRHAVEWYQRALKDDSLTGLKRNLAEKRIADVGVQSAVASAESVISKCLEGNGRPKDLALDIGGKDKLEMVGIAPGSFMMGFDEWQEFKGLGGRCELEKPRRVTITRPFWMTKYLLSRSDVKTLFPDREELRNVPDDRGCFVEIRKISLEEILEKLNSKIPNRPRGYVFRLPTAAEWEYAFKADNGENTKIGDLRREKNVKNSYWMTPEMEAYCEKNGIRTVDNLDPRHRGSKINVLSFGGYFNVYPPMNLTKANAWGIHAFCGFFGEALLDTVEANSIRGDFWIESIGGVVLPDKDPVYLHDGGVRLLRARVANPVGFSKLADRGCGIRVVLGPDLVAEKKRGGAASAVRSANRPTAPSEAARSSSANRPGKNVDRPKDMSFKLNAKESLEMVGIPSGKFMMGQSGTPLAIYKVREVEISRPFWFSKYPLTFGGAKALKAISKEHFHDMEKRRGVTDDCCVVLEINVAEEVLNKLNRRFTNRPSGYVFRFPTAAELEYAYKADKCDEVDLVRLDLLSVWRTKEVSDYGRSKSFPDNLLGTNGDHLHFLPVRMPKLNAWGIGAVGEVHGSFVLDTYDHESLVAGTDSRYLVDSFRGIDTVGAKDPVFLCQGGNVKRLTIGGRKGMQYQDVSSAGLRIVLGPDLLAEKKSGK
jgi:formylglycine-generating enzyme required for sulfatase activity